MYLNGININTRIFLKCFRAVCLKTGYVGFDWFASTVFLMMSANKERTWKFLHKFSTLISSAYLWVQRLHSSVRHRHSLPTCALPKP